MASVMKGVYVIFLICFICLLLELDSNDAARRRGRRRRKRTRQGSSRHNDATFQKALLANTVYGYLDYTKTNRYKSNPQKMPTICTNNYDSDDNGTVYGYFVCPRTWEPANFTECCGGSKNESCCAIVHAPSDSDSTGVLGLIGVPVVFFVLIFCKPKYDKWKAKQQSTTTTRPKQPAQSNAVAATSPPATTVNNTTVVTVTPTVTSSTTVTSTNTTSPTTAGPSSTGPTTAARTTIITVASSTTTSQRTKTSSATTASLPTTLPISTSSTTPVESNTPNAQLITLDTAITNPSRPVLTATPTLQPILLPTSTTPSLTAAVLSTPLATPEAGLNAQNVTSEENYLENKKSDLSTLTNASVVYTISTPTLYLPPQPSLLSQPPSYYDLFPPLSTLPTVETTEPELPSTSPPPPYEDID